MADQADDLGIPSKPVRPARAPEPWKTTDGPRPGGEPISSTPSSPTPNFLRTGSQTPFSPRLRTDQAVATRDDAAEPRKLIVGQGTSLSGEINSCDRLVVEGNVQANLQDCRHMDITETGVFNGNAKIDDVEVSGRFDGELVVRKRLTIRASGQVSGTITYGEIEIEAGGRISGSIQAPEGPKGLRTLAASLLHGEAANGAGSD